MLVSSIVQVDGEICVQEAQVTPEIVSGSCLGRREERSVHTTYGQEVKEPLPVLCVSWALDKGARASKLSLQYEGVRPLCPYR